MKKIIPLISVVLCFFLAGTLSVFAQETADAGDPYQFKTYTTQAGKAVIDFSFNALTGVLRVTYTLKNVDFDRGDANAAIRDAVAVFAKEQGFFKSRLYTEEDTLELFDNARSAKYKRFYILYDKMNL